MNSLRRNSNRSPRRDRPSNPAPARHARPKPANDNRRPRPIPANDNYRHLGRFRPGSIPRGAFQYARWFRPSPLALVQIMGDLAYGVYGAPEAVPAHWNIPAGWEECPQPHCPQYYATWDMLRFSNTVGSACAPLADCGFGSGFYSPPNTQPASNIGLMTYYKASTVQPIYSPSLGKGWAVIQFRNLGTGPANGKPEWVLPSDLPAPLAQPEWPLPAPAVYPAIDPLVLPVGVPVPQPRPIPYPDIPRRPGSNPWRAPQEQPQRGPDPRPRPFPGPAARPGRPLRPGQAVAADTAPGSKPFSPTKPHGRRPPGRNTKEKKLFDRSAGTGLGAASRVFGAMTEACDVAEALHDALPKAMQVSGGCVDKAWAVYGNFEAVDWNKAIDNLVANQIEDKAWGKIFGMRERTARNLGLHSGAAVPLGF